MSIHERFSEKDLAVLQQRAERAASVSDKNETQATLTVLQIALGQEAYGLPIDDLRAVYEDVGVVRVPGTPDFVAGIANVRGRILPVLDLAVLLDVPDRTGAAFRALVVASQDALTVAFSIETVGEVVTFAARDVIPPPSHTDNTGPTYLRGVLPGGAGLLDVAAILSDPNLIVADTF